MTFTWRGGLSNCSTTERKQVEISNRSVKTGGIFYCEFLGDFFFLSLSGLGARIPKRPKIFSQSDLVICVPEWPKICKKKKREVCGEAKQLQGGGLLAANFPRVQ